MKRLRRVSRQQAMTVAMHRAIEWSSTLDPMDDDDDKWETEFRERCWRELEKLTGTRSHPSSKLFENTTLVDAYTYKAPKQHETETEPVNEAVNGVSEGSQKDD